MAVETTQYLSVPIPIELLPYDCSNQNYNIYVFEGVQGKWRIGVTSAYFEDGPKANSNIVTESKLLDDFIFGSASGFPNPVSTYGGVNA